jgi:DNA repair exonuclease SbcCD ATPase subunit
MRSSLSDELTQVRNLTQSVQEEVESVSKPVQAVLKGNALQSTLQEVGNELKQSVPQAEGPASTKPGADEAPSAPAAPAATSQPPVPAEAPSSTTTPPTATRPSVPPPSLGLGEAVDKQVMAMAEELSEQIEQLPEALTRLGELESQQAEIASRLERMQQRLDALLMEQRDQATDDTAHSEIPALDE